MTMLRDLPALPARDGVAPRRLSDANATLASRVEVTGTLGVFVVVLDASLGSYKPGQYVSLGVDAGGELVQRPYSIVSLGDGGRRVELFIRRLPDGRLSNLLWALVPGARVRIGPARGLFVLNSLDTRPRLLIGTGTGLAPLLAMLGDAFGRGDTTPNILVHGVSWYAELAYGAQIRKWREAGLPIDYRPTVSRPHERRNAGWTGPVGRAETAVERLLVSRPAMRHSTAYLCGNPDMIESCRAVLLTAGLAPADIRAEQFHGPVGQPPKPAPHVD